METQTSLSTTFLELNKQLKINRHLRKTNNIKRKSKANRKTQWGPIVIIVKPKRIPKKAIKNETFKPIQPLIITLRFKKI